MGLEIPTNKTPGDEIRRTPAPRPAIVGLMIVALTIIELAMFVLMFNAVFIAGANDAAGKDPAIEAAPLGSVFLNEQVIISLWLAIAFFCLAYITFLYQRFFMDHVTIAKRRFRKWEDEGVQLHEF